MHDGAEEESDECGSRAGDVQGGDGGMVDVAEEEVVDGDVPVARELVPGDGVPPVGVEAAVGEVGEFGEEVELLGKKRGNFSFGGNGIWYFVRRRSLDG